MVSPERSRSMGEATVGSPRISFSAEFLDDDSFISISPGSSLDKDDEIEIERELVKNGAEFEFLSGKNSLDAGHSMLTADELFFEGKLLPYWQINHAAEKLSKINIRKSPPSDNDGDDKDSSSKGNESRNEKSNNNGNTNNSSNNGSSGILLGREQQEPRIWFVDDDPSPRPPKCTVLWKELLRLKKQRSSTLSPSSSTSSSSSSSSSSLGDAAAMEVKEKEEGMSSREKHIRRIKKGLERTKSATFRIRPMVNVPVCTQTQSGKSNSLPPLFPLKKNKA